MKNVIRSKGKIWKRRSKNLTSGEIECPRCGHWTKVSKFTDKHFDIEFICIQCRKEIKKEQAADKTESPKKKREVLQFPPNCPHKPFFGCKRPSECVGCYYNPNKEISFKLKNPDSTPRPKWMWFYHNKKEAQERLQLLDDIKNGKGLFKNGTRTYFKYARKNEDDDE